MESSRIVTLGFHVKTKYLSLEEKELFADLNRKTNLYSKILFALRDYLVRHSNDFDDVVLYFTDKENNKLPNGTWTGLIGQVNRSEVDIAIQPLLMNEISTEIVDFSYPYENYYYKFIIQQPEYEPRVFGILQTFSVSLWITIISFLIVISLVYYITLKSKYSVDKILLHVFGVFLRQSSIIRPSSSAENLLVYSWVLGAMFICLAYDSVFLSFLSFPPVSPIRDSSHLAASVKNGEYHSFTSPSSAVLELLKKSKREEASVIATDIQNNKISYKDIMYDFLYDKKRLKLALLTNSQNIAFLNVGKKFISEDRFLQSNGAMMVRKDFCCKRLIETFVHRLLASGLYEKFKDDRFFLLRIRTSLKYPEKDNSERKLTIADVAPAFIFLLMGYFISLLVFIKEIASEYRRKRKFLKKNKKEKIVFI